VGGIYTFWGVRVVPHSGQNYIFIVFLKERSRHVSRGWTVCCWWIFSPFIFFNSPLNCRLVLFVFYFSSLVFSHLISNFFHWFFCKNIISFQFSPSISFCYILIFLIWSLFFWTWFSPWPIYKIFIGFQFYISIQVYGVLFFLI
jgi:hypothetical protein